MDNVSAFKRYHDYVKRQYVYRQGKTGEGSVVARISTDLSEEAIRIAELDLVSAVRWYWACHCQ